MSPQVQQPLALVTLLSFLAKKRIRRRICVSNRTAGIHNYAPPPNLNRSRWPFNVAGHIDDRTCEPFGLRSLNSVRTGTAAAHGDQSSAATEDGLARSNTSLSRNVILEGARFVCHPEEHTC
jgi:hypothetical protein